MPWTMRAAISCSGVCEIPQSIEPTALAGGRVRGQRVGHRGASWGRLELTTGRREISAVVRWGAVLFLAILLFVIRPATIDDLALLLSLEKAASTAALGHVFGDRPFPDDDVLARWRIVLDDPDANVALDVEDDEPIGYAAYGDGWLRHFGYRPGWWGVGRAVTLH